MRIRFFIIITIIIFSSNADARENSAQLYKKGAALAMSGDINGAVGIFKSLIEQNPHYSLAHYGLGKAYLYTGKIDDSIIHLRAAVSLDRRLARGYFYLGMAYHFSKKYMDAIRAYKDAYRYNSSQIEALYNIGTVYETINRSYESGFYFEKYIKLKQSEDAEIIF